MLKFLCLLVSALVIGVPAAGLAQFSDKGKYVEVKKGTRLCSSIAVDGVRGTLNQHPIFWRVTSAMRANGTQTVSALVHETVYNRNSGDTTTVENPYDENFATFFTRAPEHKGMLQMISPQDGSVQAIVEVCGKGK
jgi:predicted DNA-binding ribbon-helix-helix protein